MPNAMSQSWQQTQSLLTEAIAKAAKIATELTQKAEIAKSNLTEVVDHTGTNIIQVTDQAQAALGESANSAITSVNQASSRAAIQIEQTTAQAKDALAATLQKAENLSNASAEALQNAIANTFKAWAEAHPLMSWLINHPFLAVVVFLFAILMMGGLLQALGSVFKQVWIVMLRSLWQLGGKLPAGVNAVLSNKQQASNPERLTMILQRLEELRQEQNQLLQEIKGILTGKGKTI